MSFCVEGFNICLTSFEITLTPPSLRSCVTELIQPIKFLENTVFSWSFFKNLINTEWFVILNVVVMVKIQKENIRLAKKYRISLPLTMVYSMMIRCIEDPFQRAQGLNCFGMDPKLVKQIEVLVTNELRGWYH